MSEETMTLSDDQLEQIGRYVRNNLPQWISTLPPQTVQVTDPVLLERMVRVEEELKAQRELMVDRFEAMDKRFEEQLEHSKQQFAAVDKRFEAVDKRFEEQLEHSKQQFAAVDKRFEEQLEHSRQQFAAVDKRFEDMNKRFDDMNKHYARTEWIVGIMVLVFMGLTTAIQVFG